MTEIKAGIFDAGGVLHFVDMDPIYQDITDTLGITPEVFTLAWGKLTPLLGRGEITEQEYWNRFSKT